jgi:predicted 3-demethylubiquinone-9 3-methyltransferase (glyoxalase superfamily)
MGAPRIGPCLWFDGQAEEAAKFYCGVFKNSRIFEKTHYGKAGHEIHGQPEGAVMTVAFELDGLRFTALNGGPLFKFNEAVSLEVDCKDQAEIDYYWEKLGSGGDPEAQQCGWLKDKFGVSWQVAPLHMNKYFNDPDKAKSERTMEALLKMKKLDIAALERAYGG